MSSPPPVPAHPSRDRLPAGPPDRRALFSGRRFHVLPLERTARAAPAEISFDLWERQGEVLARQHGAAPAEAEIDRLRRWAGESGVRLRFGAPVPPGPAWTDL